MVIIFAEGLIAEINFAVLARNGETNDGFNFNVVSYIY